MAERHLGSPAEWKVSSEAEAKILSLWDNTSHLSSHDKLKQSYDILLADRIQNTNPVSRFFLKGATRNAFEQNSIYNYTFGWLAGKLSGPHYNPVFNRIEMAKLQGTHLPEYIFPLLHEIEHARHRNVNPLLWIVGIKARIWDIFAAFGRTPVSPLMIYNAEGHAIGAQWEMASRIPAHVRKQMIRELEPKLAPLEKPLIRSALASNDFPALLEKLDAVAKDLKVKFDSKNPFSSFPAELRPTLERFFVYHYANFDRTKFIEKKEYNTIEKTLANEMDRILAEFEGRKQYGSIEQTLVKLTKISLENADLPKDQFIKALREAHGYSYKSLIKNHYTLKSGWKFYLLMTSIPAILTYWNQSDDRLTKEELDQRISKITANDFRLLAEILAPIIYQLENDPQSPLEDKETLNKFR